MKNIKIIETEAEYQFNLDRIDTLFDANPGTAESQELQLRVLLVKDYETKHFSLPEPDPIEAIKIRMQDLGLKPKDLIEYLGDKSIVSKVLNHKRALTVDQIRKLNHGLGIPAEVLIGKIAA